MNRDHEENYLIPSANQEIIKSSGADKLLLQIRPHWQAKNLIHRVEKLLTVDPSSACQRIFNACIHDLREKIVIAGLDIAGEAAKQNKFPTIVRVEDVEKLSATRVLELAYYMGLLTRPEYRKLTRVYDIRRDLEHEDNEYEAGIEDCFYIFKTTIEIVLSRDPIHLLKVTDIKEIVEKPNPTILSSTVVTDYKSAPNPRQLEIYKFLFFSTLKEGHPEIIRHNCFNSIITLKEHTNNKVIVELAYEFVKKLGRRTPNMGEVRVCYASGALPYLKKANLIDFFRSYYSQMSSTGYSFKSHNQHGELLRNFKEIGGLDYCPKEVINDIIEWLILCYIGEPGFGYYSSSRKVFFSNVGAPLSIELLTCTQKNISEIISEFIKTNKSVRNAIKDTQIARRMQTIIDVTEK